MQNKKKPSTTTGTKILIASTSLAVTFGMWSWLSYRQNVDASAQSNNNNNTGTQPAADDPSNLPPLPTLVPLRTNLNAANYNTSAALPGSGVVVSQLRSVDASSAVPAQTVRKPVVQEVIIDSPSVSTGGGGGGGGGHSKPAGSSHSSHP